MKNDRDPTSRFSDRVLDYLRFRPAYPIELLRILRDRNALTPESDVADIGCGTGKLAELFLKEGVRVCGVEPNSEMREAACDLFDSRYDFKAYPGTAERTELPDRSIDLIVVGQAFHWFDPLRCREEFARILRPGGRVALIWNTRTLESPFMKAYDGLIQRYSQEYEKLSLSGPERAARIEEFFGNSYFEHLRLPYAEARSLDEVVGFCFSASYMPRRDSEVAPAVIKEISHLFAKYATGDEIRFEFTTDVYLGQLD